MISVSLNICILQIGKLCWIFSHTLVVAVVVAVVVVVVVAMVVVAVVVGVVVEVVGVVVVEVEVEVVVVEVGNVDQGTQHLPVWISFMA